MDTLSNGVQELPEQALLEKLMFSTLQLPAIRVGIDLHIFEKLENSEKPLALGHLAKAVDADVTLLGRILRYLASNGIITETAQDTFATNKVTKILANPGNQAGIYHYFNHVGPLFQALPDFLKKSHYRDLTENTNTVYQYAYKTKQPVFEYYPKQYPDDFAKFNEYMSSRKDSASTWLSAISLDEDPKSWETEAPVFIDVAGGIGKQCAEVVAKYPSLSGRVVLQDLPHCINQALPTPGVKNVVQDIFQVQSVQGAKYYHMRGVLHDFSDEKCQKILQNIKPALRPGSLILIEDLVLPDVGVHWQATQLDLAMMCAHAAMERTKAQWELLLGSVGLTVLQIHELPGAIYESIIVAAVK